MSTSSAFASNLLKILPIEGGRGFLGQYTFLALHLSDPVLADNPAASEVHGGGYLRQRIGFLAPANRATANYAEVKFLNLPACRITHVAVWNDQKNTQAGACFFSAKLPTAYTAASGSTFTLPPYDLNVTIS